MDELEWNSSTSLYRMARYADISARKSRLLACAVLRKIWNDLDDNCKRAIEVSEAYADGKITDLKLSETRRSILITDAITRMCSNVVSPIARHQNPLIFSINYVLLSADKRNTACDILRHMIKYVEKEEY